MQTFSQRIGMKPIKTRLSLEGMDAELQHSLWSAFLEYIFNDLNDTVDHYIGWDNKLTMFCKQLWMDFFKFPVDSLHTYDDGRVRKNLVCQEIRKWYYNSEWYEKLDFIEFCAGSTDDARLFVAVCNTFLSREVSAYRIIGKYVVQINSEEEIAEIEETLNVGDNFTPARKHLQTALQLLSDRKNPDFRNSIKESISAVEALGKIVTGEKNATLGDSLKVIEKKYPLHESLKKAFSALYGYTSDSGGIRHSLKDEVTDLKFEDAKFMLVACSAFINYLIAKTV